MHLIGRSLSSEAACRRSACSWCTAAPTFATSKSCRREALQSTETTPPALRRDLERSLRSQRRAIARLSGEALKIIESHPDLKLRFDLLVSAHGSIAATSAIQILAELAVLSPDFDVRQWVADTGLDPRQCTSGSSLRKKARIGKAGNAHLRRAFYMPALVAIRHQPHLRAFYQHLRTQGKTQDGRPHRGDAQTPACHLRHVQTSATLRWFQALSPPGDFHRGGGMRTLKRKDSCTFKREIPLDYQERIYLATLAATSF